MYLVDIRQVGKVDESQLSSMSMQHGLLYLLIHAHRFTVPEILGTGATWSFISHKLPTKLPATIQITIPLTVMLPKGKILVATLANQLDM